MSTLDNAILSPSDTPDVKWLKEQMASDPKIRIAIEEDASPLGSSAARLRVQTEKGKNQTLKVYDWDDDLNTSMIDVGVKAVDLQQEGKRFAMGLRAALRKVERRYGDGYMNAVLVQLVDESDLGKDGEIGKVLRLIHSTPPDTSGRSYEDCRDAIAMEIGGRAKELRDKLKYGDEELRKIMDGAIAQYLDERFSITNLRNLGWIDENGRTIK